MTDLTQFYTDIKSDAAERAVDMEMLREIVIRTAALMKTDVYAFLLP